MPYEVKPLPSKSYKFKQSKHTDVPVLPTRALILAPSGSGKSVLLQNLITQIYDGCFVKLFVSQKTDEEMYSRLIERFYNQINVHELVIVEDPSDIRSTVREDILDQGEDTLTFLNNYVDQIDTDLDKRKLKEFAKELYVEASEWAK